MIIKIKQKCHFAFNSLFTFGTNRVNGTLQYTFMVLYIYVRCFPFRPNFDQWDNAVQHTVGYAKNGPYYVQFTVFCICLKEDRWETDEEFLFLKKKLLVFVNFEESKDYLKMGRDLNITAKKKVSDLNYPFFGIVTH